MNASPTTAALRNVLKQYADTADGRRYMQGLPGVSELHKRGWVDWRGDQYGSHFYCITDAGRAVLKEPKHGL